MKESKYNYFIRKNEGKETLWFNGYTRNFFTLDTTLTNKLRNNINILEDLSPTFHKKLLNKGFILEDEIDEIDLIRKRTTEARNSKDYFLILLPTLNCNFSCWYCVQDHEKSIMKKATIDKVKKHIEFMIKDEKITQLHIEWFGGEPFMYFDEVIKEISEFAIKQCDEAKIQFRNTATTNGYYLINDIIPKLEELRFYHFQITIDGKKQLHNKVKNMVGEDSAFDKTLGHINSILSNNKVINFTLRINYDLKNLEEEIVDDVNALIEAENRKRVKMLYRRVWQVKPSEEMNRALQNLMSRFKESGYSLNDIDINNNYMRCYSDKKYYNSISYNGKVVKCTANDDLQGNRYPGELMESGQIKWEKGFLNAFYKPRYENKICIECKHLPLCMGRCGRDYDQENDSDEQNVCPNQSSDLHFEENIFNNCV
ncbi:radical SAM protein [Labilibaculum euxinus]